MNGIAGNNFPSSKAASAAQAPSNPSHQFMMAASSTPGLSFGHQVPTSSYCWSNLAGQNTWPNVATTIWPGTASTPSFYGNSSDLLVQNLVDQTTSALSHYTTSSSNTLQSFVNAATYGTSNAGNAIKAALASASSQPMPQSWTPPCGSLGTAGPTSSSFYSPPSTSGNAMSCLSHFQTQDLSQTFGQMRSTQQTTPTSDSRSDETLVTNAYPTPPFDSSISVPRQSSATLKHSSKVSGSARGASSSSKPYSTSKSSSSVSNCPCSSCQSFVNYPGATPPSQHPCSVAGCGKVYSKSSHLKAHLRWHVAERTFTCNWALCGKRFSRSDELQRHVRQDHSTVNETNYEGHHQDYGLVGVPSSATIYACPTCEKPFSRSEQVSAHMRSAHSQGKSNSNLKKVDAVKSDLPQSSSGDQQ